MIITKKQIIIIIFFLVKNFFKDIIYHLVKVYIKYNFYATLTKQFNNINNNHEYYYNK